MASAPTDGGAGAAATAGGGVDQLASSTAPITFSDFLEKMRQPSASELVRSIKAFIAAFPSGDTAPADASDAHMDAVKVQSFLESTEAAFRSHPLWAGASDAALDGAGEGLEKYLMTKLHARAFALCPEERLADARSDARRSLLAAFVRPEHLDVPARYRNERSWTLARAELQKINTFKAPRDKLVCMLNCCKVVTNLLNVSAAESEGEPPGADDFLPVLIFVVLKAGVPQLYANLKYIERFRKESRLVSEAAYFFTNLMSAHAFIDRANSDSLSISAEEFEKEMRAAAASQGTVLDGDLSPIVELPSHGATAEGRAGTIAATEGSSPMSAMLSPLATAAAAGAATPLPRQQPHSQMQLASQDHLLHVPPSQKHQQHQQQQQGKEGEEEEGELQQQQQREPLHDHEVAPPSVPQLTVEELEMIGREEVVQAASVGELARHKFLFTPPHKLKIGEVSTLLAEYKELVLRYESLARGVTCVMAGAASGTPSPTGHSGPQQDARVPATSQGAAAAPAPDVPNPFLAAAPRAVAPMAATVVEGASPAVALKGGAPVAAVTAEMSLFDDRVPLDVSSSATPALPIEVDAPAASLTEAVEDTPVTQHAARPLDGIDGGGAAKEIAPSSVPALTPLIDAGALDSVSPTLEAAPAHQPTASPQPPSLL